MIYYFDGGCSPNPGLMEAVVVGEQPGKNVLWHKKLDRGTNNQAEWIALLWAMMLAQENEEKSPTIIGDSLLVINQALGVWKCKNEGLKGFLEEFKELKKGFNNVTLKHVLRDANLAGNYLEIMQKGR